MRRRWSTPHDYYNPPSKRVERLKERLAARERKDGG
jgi:hypothetical protein